MPCAWEAVRRTRYRNDYLFDSPHHTSDNGSLYHHSGLTIGPLNSQKDTQTSNHCAQGNSQQQATRTCHPRHVNNPISDIGQPLQTYDGCATQQSHSRDDQKYHAASATPCAQQAKGRQRQCKDQQPSQ